MDKQGAKLMKILGVAVSMLDKFEVFKPMLVRLGKKVGTSLYCCGGLENQEVTDGLGGIITAF